MKASVYVTVNGERVAREATADFAFVVLWGADGATTKEAGAPTAVLMWWPRDRTDSKTTIALRNGDRVSVRFLEDA